VVLASSGYPEKPRLAIPIVGLEEASAVEGVNVFHAGTKRNAEGEVVTAGGRVLGVTAIGADLPEARRRAYAACEKIGFEGKTYRRDIGAGAGGAVRAGARA
jgi:phosphoribosylamine---glycine ligase